MALAVAILDAFAAIPGILGYVEKFAAWVTGWYIARGNAATNAALADAAASGARALTTEDRYAAALKWHDALSRPKFSA